MRHGTAAKTFHATTAKTTHVGSAKAAHVAAAESTAAESATAVSSTATATAGLRTRGNKAAGKQGARQNHHHSSSHDILHWDRADCSATGLVRRQCVSADKRRCRDGLEIGKLAAGSTKFDLINRHCSVIGPEGHFLLPGTLLLALSDPRKPKLVFS
jgi:hypothetical protein